MPTRASSGLTVLFFASARQATGTPRLTIEANEGCTLSELANTLVTRYGPQFAAVMESCAVWVNGEPAAADSVLHAGDEVAVLPPVSGG
ncbi:MAG: MoaD/ThiS family protein [Actinomycetota bacterium]|jgi:molybdopterin converting factor subunit 1|nr:MoaD/ThiS family protein [Actinomycetota bacterium]